MPERFEPGGLAGGVVLTIHRLSQGGADRVAMLIANGLVAAGIPTALFVFRTGGEAEAEMLALLDPAVVVVDAGTPMGSRHLELLRGSRRLRRLIQHARPAVAFASSSNMGLVTGLCAGAPGPHHARFLMKLTNPVIRPRDRGPIRRAYRHRLYHHIFEGFDRVLILTDEERAKLSAMFPSLADRFRTVANPYVTPAMLDAAAPRPAGGNPRLLALARMMPQKRLDRLLEAFARVGTPDARLTIVGDGPLRAALEKQADSLGIADRVAMPGFSTDVLPWLRTADLLVLSSDYEGLPAVVLEALACNLPVVATDCFDSARSLLADAPGCAVVDRTDIAGLAAAIDGCLARRAHADLRDIARAYAVDVAIEAHVEAVRSLLAR